jgi:hypothetical protein
MRRARRVPFASGIIVTAIMISLGPACPAFAENAASAAEVEFLRQQLRRLQDRLDRLERAPLPTAIPATAQAAQPPVLPPGERELSQEEETPLETLGLPKPEIAGTRIAAFLVGSGSYNSHVQMVPDFAGRAQTLADPRSTNFRFDKFGLSLAKTFAPWLSGSAAITVESHRHRSTEEGADCPGPACAEMFHAEAAETEAVLDKFDLTTVAPLGSGLALSIGRFDLPFGIERHDEPLNLTATTSEVFQFGRPQMMTGFQTSYQFTRLLDVTAWVVNRWESETTDTSFDDNNRDKSFGGRIGITPFPREGLLNVGLGGFWGPEQDEGNTGDRWVLDLDFTWTPIPRLLLTGEVIYGGEQNVSFRERGLPFPAPAVVDQDVNWWGFYVLAHYDLRDWLGLSLRYGYLDDEDAARTGVGQILQSVTVAPIIHLSRLIPELRPPGRTYARTRHPIDWVDLKLEYRLNHSNEPVFSAARPETDIRNASETSHQIQMQVVVNF